MSIKNLGNVVGLYTGTTPPVEEDGVTEKRYILWAKQLLTSPPMYQICYFDFISNSWIPLAGVSETDFNLMKFLIFGTLDNQDLSTIIEENGQSTIVGWLQSLETELGNNSQYATKDELAEAVAKIIDGADLDFDTFKEIEVKLLQLLQADAGFWTKTEQVTYAASVASELQLRYKKPADPGQIGDNFVLSTAGNALSLNSISQNIYKNDGALTGNRILNMNSFNLTFQNLANRSADASYNRVIGLNSSGQLATVNGVSMLLQSATEMTEAQRTAYKTSMNGGWTTSTMSVAMISPLVVDNGDYNTWFSLKGANLNLNPASFQVSICDLAGNLLVNVPGYQVTLFQNGVDLNFYFNFSTLGIGKYRVRLWNGVAYYTTNTNIAVTVVANIDNIDLASIIWQVHAVPENNTTAASSGNGGNASIKDECTSIVGNTSSPIVSVKSSALGTATDDIYLDLTVSISSGGRANDALLDLIPARLGLCYSDFDITGNVFNPVSYIAWRPYAQALTYNYNSLRMDYFMPDNVVTYFAKIIFIKTGNILYMTAIQNNVINSVTIDTTKALSILLQVPNWRDGIGNSASVSVNRAFKF